MEFLKEILGEEKYNEFVQLINAYNGDEANKDSQIKIANLAGGEYVSKAKHDALQALLDGKTTELDTANGLIADLKKGTKGNEELQGKVAAYETQVTQLQDKLKQMQLESAIKVALLGAKATDVDYMTFKLKEAGELELDENGHIKGIDEKISGLKTAFPNQFESAGKGGSNGVVIDVNRLPAPNNDNTISKEAFEKMGYKERLQVYKDNPEAYAELTK